jgi:hypothetical protein
MDASHGQLQWELHVLLPILRDKLDNGLLPQENVSKIMSLEPTSPTTRSVPLYRPPGGSGKGTLQGPIKPLAGTPHIS